MSHAPKHAMLIALSSERLSAEGQRRAEQHLANCDVCRNAATGHRSRVESIAAMRELQPPSPNYEAMALALRREARAQSVASNRRTLFQALAVAAALGLAVFGAARLSFSPSVSVQSESSTVASSIAPDAPIAVSSGPHEDQSKQTQTPRAATADDVVREGSLLDATAGERVVPLWEGTEMVLAQGTQARVVMFREHRLHVLLMRGSIHSQVAKLGDGESYAIEVNDHTVNVRGTRFVVTRSADSRAHVSLSEGKVDVTRGGETKAQLIAPAQWTQDTSDNGDDGDNGHNSIDVQLVPTGNTAGAIPEGSGGGANLRLQKPTRRQPVTQGQVAPKAVQHLLARAAPLLRSCHDVSKRTHPDLPDQLQMELQIAATGQVEHVEVKAVGGTLPDDLVACLRARASTWHLALQVAAPVELLIPLQFSTSR